MKTKKRKVKIGIKLHTCFKCAKVIEEKSNYLKLITMNNEKVIEEVWFHLNPPCWSQYNDDRVTARIIDMQKVGMNMLQRAGMIA